MHSQTIDEILQALAPAIRNQKKARAILERYWSDKMAIIWATEDVHRAANEVELVITKAEAREVLQDLFQHYNRQHGIRWSDVTEILADRVSGRPITKRELARFVHKDIITVQGRKPKKRRT